MKILTDAEIVMLAGLEALDHLSRMARLIELGDLDRLKAYAEELRAEHGLDEKGEAE